MARWDGNAADFFGEIGKAQKDFQDQMAVWRDATAPDIAVVNRSSQRLQALLDVQTQVLDVASYLRLRHRFSRARWTLGGSLSAAALGAAAFAWATGPPATESVPREATAGVWRVPSDDRATVEERLGSTCRYNLERLPITILGDQGDGKELDVVTVPATGCTAIRLVVPATDVSRPPAA